MNDDSFSRLMCSLLAAQFSAAQNISGPSPVDFSSGLPPNQNLAQPLASHLRLQAF
jgi:hypothetical protein